MNLGSPPPRPVQAEGSGRGEEHTWQRQRENLDADSEWKGDLTLSTPHEIVDIYVGLCLPPQDGAGVGGLETK